jgi:hypothetical protein
MAKGNGFFSAIDGGGCEIDAIIRIFDIRDDVKSI